MHKLHYLFITGGYSIAITPIGCFYFSSHQAFFCISNMRRWEETLCSQSQSRAGPRLFPPSSPCPLMQLNIFTTDTEGEPQGHLCWPLKTPFVLVSSVLLLWQTTYPTETTTHWALSTYHKPRLQRCIQRMQPTKGTHHWLHSSQRAETHTCHPGRKKRKEGSINYHTGEVEGKTVTEIEGGVIKQTGAVRCQKRCNRTLAPSQRRQSSTGAGTSLKHG